MNYSIIYSTYTENNEILAEVLKKLWKAVNCFYYGTTGKNINKKNDAEKFNDYYSEVSAF